MAASPLPSRGPKRGQKCFVTPAFSGTPTPSSGSKIRSGPQQRGTKLEVAASPLPSRGPKRGGKCYVTPPFLGIPNAKRGEQNQKWSPTKRNKISSGNLTAAFSGAQKRAKMLPNPGILGDPQPQAWGAKSEVVPNKREQNQKWLPHPCLLGGPKERGNATSPLHSRGSPTPSAGSKIRSGPQQRGTKIRSGYLTPTFSGILNANRGEQNQKWSPTNGNKTSSGNLAAAFSGAQKRAKMLPNPGILGDPQPQARGAKSEVVPNKREQNHKWLPHPYVLKGPKERGNATSPLHSRGSPTPSAGSKIRSGPQQKGTKPEVAASPLRSQGPKRARKCYVTPTFSGIPNPKHGKQNQKWSPINGKKIRSGCPTPAFSGPFWFCSPLLGIPENAGATKHFRALLGPQESRGELATADFVSLCWGPLLILLPVLGLGYPRRMQG